jgi:hypothetical protein
VVPLTALVDHGVVKETARVDLRRFDHLINAMDLTPLDDEELEFFDARERRPPVYARHADPAFLEANESRSWPTAAHGSFSENSCTASGMRPARTACAVRSPLARYGRI